MAYLPPWAEDPLQVQALCEQPLVDRSDVQSVVPLMDVQVR